MKPSKLLVSLALCAVLAESAAPFSRADTESAPPIDISVTEKEDGALELYVENKGDTYLGNIDVSAACDNGDTAELAAAASDDGTSVEATSVSAVSAAAAEKNVTDAAGDETPAAVHIRAIAPGDGVWLESPAPKKPFAIFGDVRFWIAAGAVLFIVVLVIVMIVGGKRGRGAAAAMIAAALLAAFPTSGSAEGKFPETETFERTFSLSDGREITVSASYVVVPAPEVHPLKNDLDTSNPNEEYNRAQVNRRRITEGAGPLTSHNIYVGKNDFLFYGAAIDDFTGNTTLDSRTLTKLSEMMNARDEWARERGIALYLVICPDKSTVYSDYVPDKIASANKTAADLAVEELSQNSTVRVIDLREPLIAARDEYGDSLYYKYDTHWNNNGGYVAYREIMRRIGEDVPSGYTLDRDDFDIAEYETYMKDMMYYLGHYDRYKDNGPVYTLKSGLTATLTDSRSDGLWGQFRFCSRWSDGYNDSLKYLDYTNIYNSDAPSVYVLRDSFAVSLVHFIKDSFNRSVFNWTYDFNREEIEKADPDIVIIELVEKNLGEMINSRTFAG